MGARSLSGSSLVGFGSGGGKGTKDSSLVPFPPSRSPRVEHRDCLESLFAGGSNTIADTRPGLLKKEPSILGMRLRSIEFSLTLLVLYLQVPQQSAGYVR